MIKTSQIKSTNLQMVPANASAAFYAALFRGQRELGVPMVTYEVDFLQDQTQWFVPFASFLSTESSKNKLVDDGQPTQTALPGDCCGLLLPTRS